MFEGFAERRISLITLSIHFQYLIEPLDLILDTRLERHTLCHAWLSPGPNRDGRLLLLRRDLLPRDYQPGAHGLEHALDVVLATLRTTFFLLRVWASPIEPSPPTFGHQFVLNLASHRFPGILALLQG